MALQLIFIFLTQWASAQQHAPGSVAILNTSEGEVRIHLRKDLAPLTVQNFVDLATGAKEYRNPDSGKTIANKPFYNNTIFHRVHPDLGIHGGCPWGTGHGWPGYYLQFEDQKTKNVKFDRPYLVALATLRDRPNTGGSQFFITTKPLPEYNDKYVIFGEVFLGKEVVNAISKVKKDSMMRPTKTVKLNSIKIE